ncbi:ribonuclease Z, partial [Listeria ivanovii]
MELVFLGTGAGVPSRGRNVTSIALSMLNERNTIWLFDCGEATQHQVLRSQIKLSKLEFIFITHMHGDHIFGLPGLLSSRSFQGGDSDLTIYGPPGIREYIETSLRLSGTRLTYKIIFAEIGPGVIF